ncbi:zf-AN1 domain-containing protein/zf-A20 domain-containing protein [Cephalotus follicularis]|uniref:Zf-AN1 domain-containing protein/zf-A20 domain-containing protein n=1 Tax=Cephalotus follicularis TaxID=3775 RepID=A0A1Q3BXZ5_CEPFO|nr:zf-AN1 domain-containing protein/zf-A20 domain-containing protein [Cephalotus follicularis]
MAPKTEKEETEFKVPEKLALCANNCGVTGNPATNNMCQNCFKATTATSSATTTATSGILNFTSEKSSRSTDSSRLNRSDFPATTTSRDPTTRPDRILVETASSPGEKRVVNRCSGCRRKVGLTGFRCRCGELFCSEHRYSDRHECSYDYKTAGRDAIARENPVVKAAKIVRV